MSEMWKRKRVESYNWFFLNLNSAWGMSLLFTLVVLALALGLFIFNIHLGDDLAPDSVLGYACGIVGTLFVFLAALGYSRYRRSHKRNVGRLNGSLHWHIGFGIMAIGLLFLHSFGNFNPRSGTYALYSMMALVISGIVGRVLDRVVPRLIARDLKPILAESGESPVELETYAIPSTVFGQNSGIFGPLEKAKLAKVARPAKPLITPWDLAYISLEELSSHTTVGTDFCPIPYSEKDPAGTGLAPVQIPQSNKGAVGTELAIQTSQNEKDLVGTGHFPVRKLHHRIVPDWESYPGQPVTMPSNVEHPSGELADMQDAFQREEYYLAIIRYWRIGHIALALLTLGLILWHLEYVATLLFPLYFR